MILYVLLHVNFRIAYKTMKMLYMCDGSMKNMNELMIRNRIGIHNSYVHKLFYSDCVNNII